MKTLIISLNSKYIHSSLAPWYLKSVCCEEFGEIKVLDFTINENLDSVLGMIYNEEAQVIAFSCYIWNIVFIKLLAENLKKVSPGIKIILGGPEVSFDADQLMSQELFIDFIINGEGEVVFRKLIETIYYENCNYNQIEGLIYRHGNEIIINKSSMLIKNLDNINSPYTEEMLTALANRIVYFESSRGCPFHCSYCLSSVTEGVRFFSLQRVKSDLLKLINHGVRQIKFVDRTFNCNIDRAKEIFSFIIETDKVSTIKINFHFEIAADIFDEELLSILEVAPQGLFQFEIGLQTTNCDTLKIIDRKTDIDKIFANVERLKKMRNIHLHLDLIAGLPQEDYDSFKNSFNQVYILKPDQLQLGFLKMLKGSKIRAEAQIYDYKYKSNPPYEVLNNSCLSFNEINKLKGIEGLLDRYYNSGKFKNSLDYILNFLSISPFEFFERLFLYFKNNGVLNKSHSARDLYTILIDFFKGLCVKNEYVVFNELLKIDYLSSDNSNSLPLNINRIIFPGFKELCFDFLKEPTNIREYLPKFIEQSPKCIFKDVHFEIFNFDLCEAARGNTILEIRNVVLFDYSEKNKITGQFNYFKIPIILNEDEKGGK